MPLLQIRDLPVPLYNALKEQAQAERRSLAQQAILVLARGLDMAVDPRVPRRHVSDRMPDQKIGDNRS